MPISDTVIFCVELEHPCTGAYWTRNGEKLKEDSRISIACLLRQYTLTIRDCRADDSGEVAFVAGDCKTSTRFTVTGEEAEMLFSPSAWIKVQGLMCRCWNVLTCFDIRKTTELCNF